MGFLEDDEIEHFNQQKFLNRENILDNIELVLQNEYLSPDNFFKLYSIYGTGGMGKSRLAKEIYRKYSELNVYLINLEILKDATIPSILFKIREKFSYTPNFDYAFLQYWKYTKCELMTSDKMNDFCSSLIKKITQIPGMILGIETLNLDGYLADRLINYYRDNCISPSTKALMEEPPSKMATMISTLIRLLVDDIQAELKPKRFLMIFDSYTNLSLHANNRADWLKKFINRFRNGFFIVTSREKLDWFDGDNVIQSNVKMLSLNKFSTEDVESRLRELNFSHDKIERMIKQTDCIPLYLDILLNFPSDHTPTVGYLPIKEDIVQDLLHHLSEDERLIINYFAVVKLFNEEIFMYALEFYNLSRQIYQYSRFKESMIMDYVEKYDQISKIHSILADNICMFMKPDTIKDILTSHLKVLSQRIIYTTISLENLFILIIQIYVEISRNFEVLEVNTCEMLLDLFLFLHDNGYSLEFSNHEKIKNNVFAAQSCEFISMYIRGIVLRNIDISLGYSELSGIDVSKCNFGKHLKTLQCDINYLLSISGEYKKAEEQFILFYNSLSDNERENRYYSIGTIYYADMLILRGQFNKSILEFTLIIDSQIIKKEILYECHKAIGHSFRFNFLFEESLKQYEHGADKNHKRIDSYHLTVRCETNCYIEPELTIALFDEAIEANEKIQNNNNLGKIYYSMAIAEISNKNFQKSNDYIIKSIDTFGKTNYQAGIIFALLAKSYLEYSSDGEISNETKQGITNKIDSLDGIYEFLLLPIYIAENNESKIDEFAEKFEWISYPETCDSIKGFLLKIKKF